MKLPRPLVVAVQPEPHPRRIWEARIGEKRNENNGRLHRARILRIVVTLALMVLIASPTAGQTPDTRGYDSLPDRGQWLLGAARDIEAYSPLTVAQRATYEAIVHALDHHRLLGIIHDGRETVKRGHVKGAESGPRQGVGQPVNGSWAIRPRGTACWGGQREMGRAPRGAKRQLRPRHGSVRLSLCRETSCSAAARYPVCAPSSSAIWRHASRCGVACGRCRTRRRAERTTCTPSLSSRSRSQLTWVRAQAVRAARSRSSCMSTYAAAVSKTRNWFAEK